MKKLLLCTLITSVAISASPQSDRFKTNSKTAPGTVPAGFEYKTIPGAGDLKSSTTSFRYPSYPVFSKPSPGIQPGVKKVVRSKDTGRPIFIERDAGDLKSAGSITPEARFRNFFHSTGSLTGIHHPDEELEIWKTSSDPTGITHIRARQLHGGIEIYGAEVILHLDDDREAFTGRIVSAGRELPANPRIGAEDAAGIALQDLNHRTVVKVLTEKQKEILDYDKPSARLVYYPPVNGPVALCYEVNIRPNFLEVWKYFVDAASGLIIHHYNDTKYDGPAVAEAVDLNGIVRTIDTYLENGEYAMVNVIEEMFDNTSGEGVIMTLDANNTSSATLDFFLVTSPDNIWNEPSSVSAHFNATTTYRYLKNTFGRNSLNGLGGDIISLVNVTNEDGTSMENAYWNGRAAFYGNGGTAFKPLAGALDVAAHELGHGVVSNTANLEYQGQSGALNESFADIFGAMVDREDWQIGEDVTNTVYINSGALRDMSDPHNGDQKGWQPGHMSEMYLGEEDNGGVHINSGIVNHAYYLYATAVSRETAEQVYYNALINYLTSRSQFIDLRIAVIQSARELHGDHSTEVSEAMNAFDAVGIFEEEQVDYTQDFPPNDGPDFLLTYDTDPSNENTLYRSSTSGDEFAPLSATVMKRRVSVVDNGSAAVFVSEDSKLRAISTDPSNPDEFILSEEPFWDNVAVSRDGNRLAGISVEVDTAIYVYDFVSEQWAKFQLFNPTTRDNGSDAGGVLYADAIDFDHTGEYLMYDAYNELSTTTGDPINYWDIGFLKVWDNENGTFGDGTIMKLYGSLPGDVSIGNPVFSKNSPYIIAFDYWDAGTDEYAILGTNLVTGELSVITMNTRLGFPSYSRLDDKIAYTAHNTENGDIIAEIDLAPGKISASGDPVALIPDAIWSVYFATGNRSLILAPVPNFTVDKKSGIVPMTVRFVDLSINEPTSWEWSFEGGTPASSSEKNPTVVYETPGVFQVSLTVSNSAGGETVSKSAYIIAEDNSTGINSRPRDPVSYYPNPVSDFLHIDCEGEFRAVVYDLAGKKLVDILDQPRVDLSHLAPGVYVIRIDSGGSMIHGRLLKN